MYTVYTDVCTYLNMEKTVQEEYELAYEGFHSSKQERYSVITIIILFFTCSF